jgi:DNA topoisomerase-2
MKKEKKIEDKYKILDHIEHVLLRPQTYLGSNKPHTQRRWIFDGDKMVEEMITYIPSFLKIFDEILSNAVDEGKRNPKLNKIEVWVDEKRSEIKVQDNGGIPILLHSLYNQWIPEVIFGNLMSGSNYDDDEQRVVMGVNGLGSKLTNIFSSKFVVETGDGNQSFLQVFSGNMRNRTQAEVKKGAQRFTRITYQPELSRFGLKNLDKTHIDLIHKRVLDVAGCNTNIKFFFNGKPVLIKSFSDYIKLHTRDFICQSSEDGSWQVGIYPSSEGFSQVSFVNGSDTYDGGTHIDHILSGLITPIREHFLKKYKADVKPSEIKNYLGLFVSATVVNPSFSSQTKEKLITEKKDWGHSWQPTEQTIKWILKSEIVKSLTDWITQKKAADENRMQRQINKQVQDTRVEKLIDAKSKERWRCSIGIFEGDSASGSFRKYRNPTLQGAFSLKGKFINVSDLPLGKMTENKELVNLMSALGLKLGQKATLKTLRWGRIIFYADQDPDGNSIVALLMNFFHRFWPELFEMGLVYKAQTPLMVAENPKTGENLWFFYQSEFDEWLRTNSVKNWNINYKKGLGALEDGEYRQIIREPNLVKLIPDSMSSEKLSVWFGKNSDSRKLEIFKI